MRALRADKMTYAALEATLEEHAAGRASETVPVARMIDASAAEIGVRAEALAGALASAGLIVDVVDGFSTIGGGSCARLPVADAPRLDRTPRRSPRVVSPLPTSARHCPHR